MKTRALILLAVYFISLTICQLPEDTSDVSTLSNYQTIKQATLEAVFDIDFTAQM
jgi:hypothetical protein